MTSQPPYHHAPLLPRLTCPTSCPPHTAQPPMARDGAVSSGATGRKTVLGPEYALDLPPFVLYYPLDCLVSALLGMAGAWLELCIKTKVGF